MVNQWIDCSRTVFAKMPVYPGDPEVEITAVHTVEQDGFALNRFCSAMHAGTHLDAPSHFLENGEDVTQIPLEKTIGMANRIRVVPENGMLKTKAIRLAYDALPEKHPRLLLETGWEAKSETADFYTNFPGFEPEILDFLSENHIVLLGTDLPSVKFGINDQKTAHIQLLQKKVVIVENLIQLSKLSDVFFFSCLPLKIAGLDASMVRAVAWNRQ
jgi:kynurenine formamidase